jgi:ribosomal protein L32
MKGAKPRPATYVTLGKTLFSGQLIVNRGNLLKIVVIVFGAVLIVLGVVAYGILPTIVSKQTIAVGEAITVKAGSSVPRAFRLPNDARISGTLNTVTGGNGDIDFYAFDKTNYDKWIRSQTNTRYIFIYRASSGALFTFRTDKEADYYFVFDNPVGGWSGSDRSVNWSASYEYRPYAPYALPILLSLVVVGALLVSGRYLLKLKQKMEKLRTCPNCNERIAIENPICPHCGFDINKSIRCRYCNTFYDRSLSKCPNCGAQNK